MLMLFSNHTLQIYWLWKNVNSQDDKGFQRFLDNVQYKCRGILRYERIFGEGFVSTGGLGMATNQVFSNFSKVTYFTLLDGSYINMSSISTKLGMRNSSLMLILKSASKFCVF